MHTKIFNWRWFLPILVFIFLVAACSSETSEPLLETTAPPEVEPTAVEPTEIKPTEVEDTSKYGTLTFVDASRVVAALEGIPVIDGEEDAVWANANEINTEVWVLGSNGSTAVVKTLWDSEYLYLYAVVIDKLLSKASGNAYEQDSFEVFIDQNNAKTSTYQVDDGQYRINYDNEATFNGGASADLLTSATKITPDGYIVELAIKFDHIEPQEGMLIGFDVQVNNDENGNGIRDSVVTWNDSTHQGYQNTSGLGVLLFIK